MGDNMEAKKLAIVLAIAVLLPLFLGLFVDAVYTAPKYEDYCNYSMYAYPAYKQISNMMRIIAKYLTNVICVLLGLMTQPLSTIETYSSY
jgi:hypothetical protein